MDVDHTILLQQHKRSKTMIFKEWHCSTYLDPFLKFSYFTRFKKILITSSHSELYYIIAIIAIPRRHYSKEFLCCKTPIIIALITRPHMNNKEEKSKRTTTPILNSIKKKCKILYKKIKKIKQNKIINK